MTPRLILLNGLACLALLLAPPARALDIPMDIKMKLLGEADKGKALAGLDGETPDNSIDTSLYMVGGGDAFQISIVGMPSQEYFLVVDPSGNMYDGDLGVIILGKIPLARAQAIIGKTVRKSLRKNHEVYVALKKLKTATVSVTGVVANPGTYMIPGNLRLLDAIRIANTGYMPAMDRVDLRSVEVRSGDSVRSVDLMRFLSGIDLSANPYVYPGDNIVIRSVDSRVFLTGEVLDPVRGGVPLKPGETVGDILDLVRLRATADSGSILVRKAGRASDRAVEVPKTMAEARAIRLGSNDVIMVGAKERRRRPDTIQVTGEVYRPGTYAFEPGQTTLEDLLRQAGGPTGYGDPSRVFILRNRKKEEVLAQTGAQESAFPGMTGAMRPATSLQTVRPEVASSVSDLKLSGDFTVLEGPAAAKKGILEDGDEIHLPRKDHFVYVSGNVRKPGAYAYKQGASAEHYIREAQGYTDKADTKNQYVLAMYQGVTQIRETSNPRSGDIIVVPAAVEYKRFSSVFLPIIQIVPGILSLFVTILVLTNQ